MRGSYYYAGFRWFRRIRVEYVIVLLLAAAVFSVPVNALVFGASNVGYVRERAESVWQTNGFEVVGYQGYERSMCWFDYGCGNVWYTLERRGGEGIVYEGALQRWGDEIHLYSIRAIDAIKP